MNNNLLFEIFVFLVSACAVVPLLSQFKLGSILGYIIAGIIIGPWGFSFIADPKQVMHFAEFGVVMMLFMIGLELEPIALWRLRRSIFGFGGLQVLLTTVLLTCIGLVLHFDWHLSLAVSMALSLSSTALVIQMLNEKNFMNTSIGDTSFSILLFQDMAVIPILVLMPLLAMPEKASFVQTSVIAHLPGYIQVTVVAFVITAVILGGRYLSHHLFRTISRTNLREIFTAISLALLVGITLVMQLVGVSPVLGAFIAGVVLANSEYRRTLETDIEPFKGLLLGLFFISVGMGIDFELLIQSPTSVIIGVMVLMFLKASILWILGRFFNMSALHNIGHALALSQAGEFAFVLFQFAGSLEIIASQQIQFLTLVVALSMGATPLLMFFYQTLIMPKFITTLPEHSSENIERQHPIILAGFGRFGQVIGRFLTGQGVKITILEKDPDQIDLIRKFGFKGYFGDASRLDLLISAGIKKAKLLIVAVDDVSTSLEIAKLVKEQFPRLIIFARARNRQHAYELHKLGIHYFKREVFDSSLNMAKEIMIWLGKKEADVELKLDQFKRHDEETLHDSFQFFDDDPMLVSFTKTRSAELKQILQSDISDNLEK